MQLSSSMCFTFVILDKLLSMHAGSSDYFPVNNSIIFFNSVGCRMKDKLDVHHAKDINSRASLDFFYNHLLPPGT